MAGVFTATRIGARSRGTGLDTDLPLSLARACPFHVSLFLPLAGLQLKMKHTQCHNAQQTTHTHSSLLGVAFCIQHRNRGAASQKPKEDNNAEEEPRIVVRIGRGFGIGYARGRSHANSSLNFAQSQKFKTPNQTNFFWGLSSLCSIKWVYLVSGKCVGVLAEEFARS